MFNSPAVPVVRVLLLPVLLAAFCASSPALAQVDVGGGSDTTAPELVGVSITPTVADPDSADPAGRTVAITVHVTDDLSGWDGCRA